LNFFEELTLFVLNLHQPQILQLIHTNNPDLVLFVGEALVGNEAVDQLVKFNQALADHSAVQENPRLIDGIVLTKFDTIDDKVRFE
jgi:signal recognition particle receptor subunit alpha